MPAKSVVVLEIDEAKLNAVESKIEHIHPVDEINHEVLMEWESRIVAQ